MPQPNPTPFPSPKILPPPPQPLPRVVMGPISDDKGRCFRELFEHPEQWEKTRALVQVLLFPDRSFADPSIGTNDFTDDELRTWLAQLQKWGLKLELEVGALKEWGITGEKTLKTERPAWDRIIRLGGKIDSIAMDEPFCCAKFLMKPPRTREYAVEETANFIALVRKEFPDTAILDIETYPSLSLEENLWWIDALQTKLAEKGVRGLDGYRLDVDWVCFNLQNKGASWRDVVKIQQFCHSRNLPFSLLYWAPGYNIAKALGTGDDSTWYTGIIEQGYNYDQITKAQQSGMSRELKLAVEQRLKENAPFGRIDGGPDQYVIESYVGAPQRTLPETGDFTFTRSVLDFVKKFVKEEERKK